MECICVVLDYKIVIRGVYTPILVLLGWLFKVCLELCLLFSIAYFISKKVISKKKKILSAP